MLPLPPSPPQKISIHALLAESDPAAVETMFYTREFLSTLSLRRATRPSRKGQLNMAISIHALLAESDFAAAGLAAHPPFLSTLSLRRATTEVSRSNQPIIYFYPRSPCGERLWPGLLARPFFIISIHALLAESDDLTGGLSCDARNFYPRSPCGERRNSETQADPVKSISIHALLAESDL